VNPTAVTDKTFAVTAAELFAVRVDPDSYPRWLTGTKNISNVSSDWPARGSYFKHTVGFGPIAIPDRTTVRDVETAQLVTLFVRARPVVEAIVQLDVTSNGDACTLRMTKDPVSVYKVIAPLACPLIRARSERSLQRLKDFVETQHAPGISSCSSERHRSARIAGGALLAVSVHITCDGSVGQILGPQSTPYTQNQLVPA